MSITEQSNALTTEIDLATPEGAVRMLRQADAQMFSGFGGLEGLNDESVLEAMCAVARAAHKTILAPEGVIVLSGCGTSGRVAHLISRSFNAILGELGLRKVFRYFNAGGDGALFRSSEAPEDNWKAAAEQIKLLLPGDAPAVYVGITCGLSAPAVASQIEYCLARPNTTTVLLGFNPPHLARTTKIEGWDRVFADVVKDMQARQSDGSSILLLPVVGPEAITGSTRMKGGSATKLILEIIFSLATASLKTDPATTITSDAAFELLWQYESTVRQTYMQVTPIAHAANIVGQTLLSNHRLVYLSSDTFGLLALIDASECPPTFNAHREHVRTFIAGGYTTLANDEGDMSGRGALFQLSLSDFTKNILSTLNAQDLVVIVTGTSNTHADTATATAHRDELFSAVTAVSARGIPLMHVCVSGTAVTDPISPSLGIASTHFVSTVTVPLEHAALTLAGLPSNTFLSEISLKLVLNALTTIGHVIKGKVVQNRMIDLQVSNNKLFFRAIGIIALFSETSEAAARHALLQAIYGVTDVTPAHEAADVSAHVAAAVAAADGGRRVVPLAIVLARTHLPPTEGAALLAATPVVRTLLASLQQRA
eukprot:m.240581 g.240581  ORF g.240581 m.240581 type:complete len:597 (+) comp23477_c0_seq1:25-1815(+)